MTTRTRFSMTTEESAPGVPFWATNQVVTDLPIGETEVALENLVAGSRYYVKTWNEDVFGNRSRELVRVVHSAHPTRLLPLTVASQGVLDSDSGMRTFVKVPAGATVQSAKFTVVFREFFASARTTVSSGTLTSDSGGASTTPSGGGGTSSELTLTLGMTTADHTHDVTGVSGAASAGTAHTHTDGSYGAALGAIGEAVVKAIDPHTHTTPTHVHSTPAHSHDVPTHSHEMTYGTFEETYPATHSVRVLIYQRAGSSWSLVYTSDSHAEDLFDTDVTDVITDAGDWRIDVKSDAAQPNNGRLGCDVFGLIEVVL